MHIVADQDIAYLDYFFSDVGKITRLPGREINYDQVKQADVLLVRSITQVNESLLQGHRPRFIGSTTIGIDHVDLDYLHKNNIPFSNAPGCNASAVVDYVLTALYGLVPSFEEIKCLTVGIVGVGHVGLMLRRRLEGLGVNVLAVDPHRTEKDVGVLSSLLQVLKKSDVVTLHVPLVTEGSYQTHHLINEARLLDMKKGACLMNTSRGAVVDNRALKNHLMKQASFSAVLDVWENEPNIDVELMNLCRFSTPHIAGHSLDGKFRGTQMIYQALCKTLKLNLCKGNRTDLLPVSVKLINKDKEELQSDFFKRILHTVTGLKEKGDRMKHQLPIASTGKIAEIFDRLRASDRTRRDIHQTLLSCNMREKSFLQALLTVGFSIDNEL